MAEIKRYYWLKLKEDFFTNSLEIKKLRRLAGGDTYTIIYLKMQLLSIKNEGKLYYEGIEEDFCSELALRLDEAEDDVKLTLAFLDSCGLIENNTKDEYFLNKVPEMIGKETEAAARMRRVRERERLPKPSKKSNNVQECSEMFGDVQNVRIYRDTSTNTSTHTERESMGSNEPTHAPKVKKQKYGEYKNVLLTDDEHSKIIAEPNGIEAIEFLSAYIAEKTYKSKSHYLAIKRWVLNAVGERAGKGETKSILDPLMRAAQKEMERCNGKN